MEGTRLPAPGEAAQEAVAVPGGTGQPPVRATPSVEPTPFLDGAIVPLTEEEATRRHFGEVAADHPEELVRRRRRRDRQWEVSAAQERLRDIIRRLHEAEVAAGRARDALDGQLKATQARGVAITSYFEQRKAVYLNGLAHRHHRGPELLRALAFTDPGLPEWLSWNTEALEGA